MGNIAILTGFVGRDPRIAYTQAGGAIANFTLATHERWTDKKSGQKVEHTEWHRIVAWNGLAEMVAQYITQGRQVQVTGRIKTRSWTDDAGVTRYVTEIHAKDIEFLGSRKEGTLSEDETGIRPVNAAGRAVVAEQQPNPQITNPLQAAHAGCVKGVKQMALPGWPDDDIPF